MSRKVATSSAYQSNPFKKAIPTHRAKLTRKVSAILEGDGRLALPRRFRDLCACIAADQGGAERLPTIKLDLIRRYAGLAILAERIESDLINGREVDLSELVVISSTLSRLATRIGMTRSARDVTPSLDQYVRDTYSKRKIARAPIIDHDDDSEDED